LTSTLKSDILIVIGNGTDHGNVRIRKTFSVENQFPRKKRATIKVVAQEAGVSAQTVSRVLNNRPDVAPETRQRVKDVIAALEYHPSAVARSLIKQRSYTLGVVIAGLRYLGPSGMLNGITRRAEKLGYALLLKELPDYQIEEYQTILQNLLARQVDGIIWAVSETENNRDWVLDKLSEIPVPVMFVGASPLDGVLNVTMDNYEGGCVATRHLLAQGYRHIGHISGPIRFWESQSRRDGWMHTLEDTGIPVCDNHWTEGDWTSSGGNQAFQKLIEQYPKLDAVFVSNDQMALGVLHAISKAGKQVPQDLAVVGFDGAPDSEYYCPPLSTICQDLKQLGCTSVDALIKAIEAGMSDRTNVEYQTIVMQPELLVRDSSQPKSSLRK
jgi:DNA-binding LacI/PurR family transcriptional regulator